MGKDMRASHERLNIITQVIGLWSEIDRQGTI